MIECEFQLSSLFLSVSDLHRCGLICFFVPHEIITCFCLSMFGTKVAIRTLIAEQNLIITSVLKQAAFHCNDNVA